MAHSRGVDATRPPKVFISATSGDLRSIRQIIKEALLTINCHPIEQTNFEPDARSVADMLRSKIGDCQALIHVAGIRYGAEPDPASIPPGTPRRSYTQLEYHIARQLQQQRGASRFRVYTFVCPEDFPYDTGAEVEPEEKQRLQRQHRTQLFDSPQLFEQPDSDTDLRTRILSLQETVHTLRETADRRHRRTLLVAATILVALLGIGWGTYRLTQKSTDIATQQKQLITDLQLERLTDRALSSYQERFRRIREQSKELPNAVIDKMVRAELPSLLKVDAATVARILDTEAPRLAAGLDTPLDRKLSALFVMGEYQSVLDTGEKRLVDSGIPALRTMGDAARALFDKTPNKKHLEAALRYYTGAAALTDRIKNPLAWADNQIWAARTLTDLARYTEAEPLLRAVLEICERELGQNDLNVATSLNNLALLLRATNRLAEAEPQMRRALAVTEANLGKDHPAVAINLNTLATLLQDSNRLSEAEPLLRRAIDIGESRFGKDDASVAVSLNHLALLLAATDRLAEAEPLMRRVLAICEDSFGNDHPNVAINLNNLALLLQSTSRIAEAEPLMRRALAIAEASFGKDHPDVATNLTNLAILLYSTNRLAEAEPLMRRSLVIFEASFGKDHPNAAQCLNNLGQLLHATNRLGEAEPLLRRALQICEDSLGKEHPNTVNVRHNLDELLEAKKKELERK